MYLEPEIQIKKYENAASNIIDKMLEAKCTPRIVKSHFGKSIEIDVYYFDEYPKVSGKMILYCEEEKQIDRFIYYFNQKEYGIAQKILMNFGIVNEYDVRKYGGNGWKLEPIYNFI